MELQLLWQNDVPAKRLVIYGRVRLAQLDTGKWVALNHESTCPTRLTNRDLRGVWARTQGYTLKEVESYVRKQKNAKRKEDHADQLQICAAVLAEAGYTVVDKKGEVFNAQPQ